VAPWNIGQVPERYLIAAPGLNELKKRRQRLQQNRAYIERMFSNWRSQKLTNKRIM